MADLADLATQDRVAVITLNHPPVNALSSALCGQVLERLRAALADGGVDAIVLIGGGRAFSGGWDVREMSNPPPPGSPGVRDVIAALEGASKPVVAAIHGVALGGGLEVTLGCHWRVATADARVGLPEVKLGLLPGAGGTQRLPRIIGAEQATRLIVAGEQIDGATAAKLGVVDALIEGELRAGAVAFARRLVEEKRPLRRTRDLTVAPPPAGFFEEFRKSLAKSARGLVAPQRCVDCVEAAMALPFDEGLKRERELFQECVTSPQAKGLVHAFFSERKAADVPGLPADAKAAKVAGAAVIGAGTMGGGIAMCFANAGLAVKLIDMDAGALERGIATIRRNYESTMKRGRLTQAELDARMALITPHVGLDGLADVDLVIEAVFEEMGIKKQVFAALDRATRPDIVLATNTSTLDIDEMASATARPDKVIGMHFFSPANVMRLLEVVRGKASAPATIATAMKTARDLKKVGVLVGNCDGFVGNRMLAGYGREAQFLVEEGAMPQDVDRVIFGFGFPMGPFAMGDLAGLDVGWRIRKARAGKRPNHLRYSPLGDRICERGWFGQKTGRGWYRYEAGDRTPRPDPEIEALIIENSKALGIERRRIDDQEILERCLYPLVNEAARILEEGIAARASDIDVVWLNGYGFPAWRGGPMHWADTIGAKAILEAVERYHARHGESWAPAPLLRRLAAENGRFLAWTGAS